MAEIHTTELFVTISNPKRQFDKISIKLRQGVVGNDTIGVHGRIKLHTFCCFIAGEGAMIFSNLFRTRCSLAIL
jgi:hypothetical protein